MVERDPEEVGVTGSKPVLGIMRQCKLQLGNRYTTAWLPREFAVKGMYLEIHGENGWLVLEVGAASPGPVREQRGYFAGGVSR